MDKQDSLLNIIHQLTEELDCIDEELISQWNTINQQFQQLKEENYQLKINLAISEHERDLALERLDKSQQDNWLKKLKQYVKANKEQMPNESLKLNHSFPNPLVSV